VGTSALIVDSPTSLLIENSVWKLIGNLLITPPQYFIIVSRAFHYCFAGIGWSEGFDLENKGGASCQSQ
jgi:hypothetical protein